MSVKLNIVSDLHYQNLLSRKYKENELLDPVDFNKFNYNSDFIIIAGDIATKYEEHKDALSEMLKYTEKNRIEPIPIIYTLGNHDFWRSDGNKCYISKYEWFNAPRKYMNETLYAHKHRIVFISTPLFTDIYSLVPELGSGLGDCKNFIETTDSAISSVIDGYISFHDLYQKIFMDCLGYLVYNYTRAKTLFPNYKIVFITHHAPKMELIKDSIIYNSGFERYWASDCVALDNLKPDIWIHGHSHEFCDETIDGVRYIRNPLRDYSMKISEEAYKYTIEI